MTCPSKVKRPALAMLVLTAALPAAAETTVSLNLEYAEGKYGEAEKSTTWTMPLIVKHRAGAWGLKLYVPYVRAAGIAAPGGDRSSPVRQTQEGVGDISATAIYDIYGGAPGQLIVGVGAKAKFAPAAAAKELITTGKNDYSLLLDASLPVGSISLHASFGRTKKGDPEGVDFRDPWFASLVLSHQLSDVAAWGMDYYYRQKLTASDAPVSEAALFAERELGDQSSIQLYVLRGFANASPDLAVGATLSWHF